jgi:hypothetical protein
VDTSEQQRRLAQATQDHTDLSAAIDALRMSGSTDMLQMARLKKRKLRLKDEIAMIQDRLVPDWIA